MKTEREFATGVVRRLRDAGFESYFAGGCVRDELLGLRPDDYDVATAATPERVRGLFRRTVAVGASFGVIEVLGPRDGSGTYQKVQVATFRSDGTYSDGRRPDSVTFSGAEEDARRRDFTINGMFLDPLDGDRIIDHVGGRVDLEARLLRAIGDPAERIREDKLRMLRAVRMATRFDLRVEDDTRAAIVAMAGQIGVVSAERIAEELRKMLVHPNRAVAVRMLDELGLLAAVTQLGDPKAAAGARWGEVLASLGALDRATFPLALAALSRFTSRKAMARVGRDLRLSNEERERAEWLVENADALAGCASFPCSRLYPLLVAPGIAELTELTRATALARGAAPDDADHATTVRESVSHERLDPPHLLSGDDLRAAGLKPGPEFKRLLDATRAAQLDGEISDREAAREFALALHRRG